MHTLLLVAITTKGYRTKICSKSHTLPMTNRNTYCKNQLQLKKPFDNKRLFSIKLSEITDIRTKKEISKMTSEGSNLSNFFKTIETAVIFLNSCFNAVDLVFHKVWSVWRHLWQLQSCSNICHWNKALSRLNFSSFVQDTSIRKNCQLENYLQFNKKQPGKSGRKLGSKTRRPVLYIHCVLYCYYRAPVGGEDAHYVTDPRWLRLCLFSRQGHEATRTSQLL